MADLNSVPSLLDGWSIIKSPWSYLGICFFIAIVLRVVNAFIKVLSTKYGEHGDELAKVPFLRLMGYALSGFHKGIADHWLGTTIGFAEISIYPILLITNNLPAIGGWLAIKTAGSWSLWQREPRAFNRFLICNIINLVIAYFLAARCV
jgi:hypothetical protein